jgi:hypothetical protein
MACRSIQFRILQLAEDEGAITANPLVAPPPERQVDPDQVLGHQAAGLHAEEAGQLRLQTTTL